MIELKGIVQYEDLGHRHVDVVVSVDGSERQERSTMGVDIKVNRGKVLTFLSAAYGVEPGDIVWPGHIKVE